jgi:hypothetical protein
MTYADMLIIIGAGLVASSPLPDRPTVEAKERVAIAVKWLRVIIINNNEYFYIPHISIPRMLTALGIYFQKYRGRPCPGFKPGLPVCQHFALTTRQNIDSNGNTLIIGYRQHVENTVSVHKMKQGGKRLRWLYVKLDSMKSIMQITFALPSDYKSR